MARGVIYRRKAYQCCKCGKKVLLLPRTVSDPKKVECYECATAQK